MVTGLPFSPNRKGALLLGRGSLGVLYGWGQGLGLAAGVLTAGPTVRRGGLLYTPTAPIPSPRLDPLRPESRGLGRGCPAPLRGMEGSCSSLPLEGPAWDTSGAVICIIFIKGWHLGGGTLPAPPHVRPGGRLTSGAGEQDAATSQGSWGTSVCPHAALPPPQDSPAPGEADGDRTGEQTCEDPGCTRLRGKALRGAPATPPAHVRGPRPPVQLHLDQRVEAPGPCPRPPRQALCARPGRSHRAWRGATGGQQPGGQQLGAAMPTALSVALAFLPGKAIGHCKGRAGTDPSP